MRCAPRAFAAAPPDRTGGGDDETDVYSHTRERETTIATATEAAGVWAGRDARTELVDLLAVQRVADLNVHSRVVLLDALQQMPLAACPGRAELWCAT